MNQSPMLPPIRTKSQKIKKMLRTTSESALPQIPETRAIRQITPKLPPIKSEGTPTMAAMGGIDIISSNSVGTTVDTRLLTHSLSDSLLRTNADVSAKLHLLRTYSQRERKRKWTSCINHVQQVRNVEKLSKTLGKSISSGLLEMSRVISHAHEQREHAVQQRSLSWMSDSIDATKMDRRMSDAELNDLQSKRSLQSTAKHFRKVNEYLSHCRRLDNRLELKANVVKIRKERRRKIGGRLIVSNNIIRAGDRALAQCDHQQWLHKQRKWKTRSKRNRQKLQRSTTRSRRRSAMECKKHQKMADLQRQKSISKRALQSKVQRRWLSLITVTLPRIVRLIELHQNEQDVKDYLDQRREASIKIQRWFRERVEVRNAKHHSHLAFMLLRTESQRQFNVGMNRSADIIKHFLHILISSNPTHYQMRKQSYHFKQQVIRLQRYVLHSNHRLNHFYSFIFDEFKNCAFCLWTVGGEVNWKRSDKSSYKSRDNGMVKRNYSKNMQITMANIFILSPRRCVRKW